MSRFVVLSSVVVTLMGTSQVDSAKLSTKNPFFSGKKSKKSVESAQAATPCRGPDIYACGFEGLCCPNDEVCVPCPECAGFYKHRCSAGGYCNPATFEYNGPTPSSLSAVHVANIWKSMIGVDNDLCVSAVAVAYGESAAQDGISQGAGCLAGRHPREGNCFDATIVNPDPRIMATGLWQISGMPYNPPHQWGNVGNPVVDPRGCTTMPGVGLSNPCCNAYVAYNITQSECYNNGNGTEWGGDMIQELDPFCMGMWTGEREHADDPTWLYRANKPNAELACAEVNI